MSTLDLLDNLPARVGEDLGVTGWQTITQADIQMFADATRAHEWIHVDVERCITRSCVREDRSAWLSDAVAGDSVRDRAARRRGAGRARRRLFLDRVRFPAPVPVGARVRARGTLRSAVSEGDGVRTVVELVYEVGTSATRASPRSSACWYPPLAAGRALAPTAFGSAARRGQGSLLCGVGVSRRSSPLQR